jgi:ketosteroid isomerase-like protein
MGLSNIEVVQRALAAFESTGFADIEPFVEWVTEDVELRSAIVGGAEGNVYCGHDGIRAWARQVSDALDELHLIAEDFREVGGFVVGLGHVKARGGASGLELDVPSGWVVEVRDGRVARMHGYLDHDSALEAAREGVK